MMLGEQIGFDRLAADVACRRRQVHHFTGGLDREHTPEWNILGGWAKRDFPTVCLNGIHNGGGNQHDEECDRPELRRSIIDALWTNLPHDQKECEKAGKEEDKLKHGSRQMVSLPGNTTDVRESFLRRRRDFLE